MFGPAASQPLTPVSLPLPPRVPSSLPFLPFSRFPLLPLEAPCLGPLPLSSTSSVIEAKTALVLGSTAAASPSSLLSSSSTRPHALDAACFFRFQTILFAVECTHASMKSWQGYFSSQKHVLHVNPGLLSLADLVSSPPQQGTSS